MVHNLLWMEDSSDSADARRRAEELRKRGFEEAVRSCVFDENLDVRERAKGNIGMWESGSQGAVGAGGSGSNVSGMGSRLFGREREREREREMRDDVEGRDRRGPWP
jgi:hypothetical protein